MVEVKGCAVMACYATTMWQWYLPSLLPALGIGDYVECHGCDGGPYWWKAPCKTKRLRRYMCTCCEEYLYHEDRETGGWKRWNVRAVFPPGAGVTPSLSQ